MLFHLLLFCACFRIAVLAVAEQYTNEWAVQLQGIAPEEVDALAEKHGFVNYGKVYIYIFFLNYIYDFKRDIETNTHMCVNFRCIDW